MSEQAVRDESEALAQRARSGLDPNIKLSDLLKPLQRIPQGEQPLFGYLEITATTEFEWERMRAALVSFLTDKPKLTCDASPGHFTVSSPAFRLRVIRPALQPR